MIASEADGRNMHREIVRGMKAKSINRYPLSNKLESDNRIKPTNRFYSCLLYTSPSPRD